MLQRPLNIAVIGSGRIADTHARGYRLVPDKGRIHTTVDVNETLAREKAEMWGAERWTADYRDALADDVIDAVDVCVPNYLHHRVVMDAIQAGKQVLVEKPLATNLEEADEMIAAASEAGVLLMVAHNHIFNAIVERASALIHRGAIGDVFMGKGRWIGWFELRPDDFRRSKLQVGGGMFADTGPHPLYLIDHLCGPISSVAALGASSGSGIEAEDTAVVSFHLENGGLGEITISITAHVPGRGMGAPAGWHQGVEIFGTKGYIRVSVAEERLWVYAEGDEFHSDYKGGNVEIHIPNSRNAAFDREISHFLDCLRGQAKPRVTPEDGRRILQVINAANRSMETGAFVSVG